MKLLFLIGFILNSVLSFTQTRVNVPDQERVRNYDVIHIKIRISFDREENQVLGNVETKITPLSSSINEFETDAVAFEINFIRDIKGNDINYDYDGKKIKIKPEFAVTVSDTFVYTVDYACKPQRGLYFIYPDELNPSTPYQIWTQGEADDNRYWLPLYDYPNDKTTFELTAEIENKYKTLSNGYLNSSSVISGTDRREDHWIMDKPNSTYLIMFAAGDFNITEDKFKELPVNYYTDKNVSIDEAKFTFRNTPSMVEAFNEYFGYEYPWNKYSQIVIENFIFGGMENTTATVMNKRIIYSEEIEKDFSSESTISHELGHQWFGDLVTCKNWSEMWLNESFATFSSALWKEKKSGNDEYDYDILRNGDDALRAESISGRYPVWAGYGSVTANLYDKGSVMLNTFRYILGDKFFPSLQTFLRDNEFGNVTTSDFINSINKTTGQNYDWMVNQWIMKAGYPEFDVSYNFDKKNNYINLTVRQVQNIDTITPLFRVPVEIRIKNKNENWFQRIEINSKNENFKIPFSSKPDFVVFDYGNNIFDKLNFDKSFDDWKNQIEQSEDAVDRITGVRGVEVFLKNDTSSTQSKPIITINQMNALKVLENCLNDKFWGVRAEAVKILGKNIIPYHTFKILSESYNKQNDSRIKREIIKALGEFNDNETIEFIKNILIQEENNYILTDCINSLAKILPKNEIYDLVYLYLNRESHRDILKNAVIDALDSADNSVDDERIKKIFMDIAFGIDIDGRLRANAINALKKYAGDSDVKERAIKYADFNFMVVKRTLINLLVQSGDRSLTDFLKDLNNKTTDLMMNNFITASIKKLESINTEK